MNIPIGLLVVRIKDVKKEEQNEHINSLHTLHVTDHLRCQVFAAELEEGHFCGVEVGDVMTEGAVLEYPLIRA